MMLSGGTDSLGGTVNNLSIDVTEYIIAGERSVLLIFPSVFLLVFLSAVLLWSFKIKDIPKTTFYLTYSGHELRWILTILLILVHLSLITEDVIKGKVPLIDLSKVKCLSVCYLRFR